MRFQKQFVPIEPRTDQWPITKLHKNQKDFLTEVADRSFESLRARYPIDTDLYRMLTKTTAQELTRIASDPWLCDPKDDCSFWEEMELSIQHKMEPAQLLKKIVVRYVGEMSSKFSVRYYQVMTKSIHHIFINLLKPHCFGFGSKLGRWTFRCKRLQEKFHLMGELETLRALAAKGTVVLAPTHTSHWDSVVVGLAMKWLGLPPLSWGTGLNLFNKKIFRYIFGKLGTYKVDRRKQTIPYLETQKHYACLTLEWGCHTLFYPSGTRSRSGAIASDLKLGLLATPFEAQQHNFQKDGADARKVFIVPIVLNYHCVLEAHQLISAFDQLAVTSVWKQNCCHRNLLLSKNILLKGSEIFINIGTPLDVMGNKVDVTGRSYDAAGQEIDLYSQFISFLPKATTIRKRTADYVKILSHKIVETHYHINPVLTSHLVAFVAYELAQKMTGFSIQLSELLLKRELFMVAFSKTYEALSLLYKQKKIAFTPVLQSGHLDTIVRDGFSKLGIYHAKRPLVVIHDQHVLIQDFWMLLYYHNRLTGYGLEKLFIQ